MYMYVCELKSQWVNCDVVEQGPNTVDGEYYGKVVVFSVLEVVPIAICDRQRFNVSLMTPLSCKCVQYPNASVATIMKR